MTLGPLPERPGTLRQALRVESPEKAWLIFSLEIPMDLDTLKKTTFKVYDSVLHITVEEYQASKTMG